MKTALFGWAWVVWLTLLTGTTVVALAEEEGEDRQVVDFNGDGMVDVDDLNEMLKLGPLADGFRVEPGGPIVYDMNRDGWVNVTDVSVWLQEAAAMNHLAVAYAMGDGNLDGLVDTTDFKLWDNQKFTTSLAWDDGDYNCDGQVDVSDFNVWNSSRSGTFPAPHSIPEPASTYLVLAAIVWACRPGRLTRPSRNTR